MRTSNSTYYIKVCQFLKSYTFGNMVTKFFLISCLLQFVTSAVAGDRAQKVKGKNRRVFNLFMGFFIL